MFPIKQFSTILFQYSGGIYKMKNAIFTLFLGGLMTVSAYASDVTVTFPNNRAYQVLIDGRSISNSNYYNNSVNLNNLRPGQHSIQIYNSSSRRNGNNLVYSSDFTLRPQFDLFITVANNGRVKMSERRDNNYGANNGYGRYDGNDRRNRDDRDRHHDRDNDDYNRNNGNYDRNYGNRGNNNYGNRENTDYSRAMSDASFNELVSNIRGAWFGKYSKAKTAVSQNYFTTYQVKQLVQIFSSESERLELAKLAYRNTVDQRNYYSLYDVFSSQSSRDDLDRYIRNGGY